MFKLLIGKEIFEEDVNYVFGFIVVCLIINGGK